MKNITDICVDTKTWRDRTFGNTYESSRISILRDGQENWSQAEVVPVAFQISGPSAAQQHAGEALSAHLGLDIPYVERWARENNIRLTFSEEKARKRVCEDWGRL